MKIRLCQITKKGENMKKALITTIIIIMAGPVSALTMCADNWLVNFLPLSSSGSSGRSGMWAVTGSAGSVGRQTISGMSICSMTPGSAATPCPGFPSVRCRNLVDSNFGPTCWCRMTSPKLGANWVFLRNFPIHSPSECENFCATDCGSAIIETDGSNFHTVILQPLN